MTEMGCANRGNMVSRCNIVTHINPFVTMKSLSLVIILLISGINFITAQTFTEILGRPTDRTMAMSILFDRRTDVFFEYGTAPGIYSLRTDTFQAKQDTALEADFINLLPDARYFYKTMFKPSDSITGFTGGTEHSFNTQRPAGRTFTFAIEADPHLDTNTIPASYTLTLQNIQSKDPDFLIDLGDNFMSEKLAVEDQTNITARHLLYRPYYGIACNSSPLYLVLGNHEGELGWMLSGTADCLPVMAANTRKMFYPNPHPNTFYSGDSIPQNFVGLRGDYYSWHWGNALFIVLDPFWYTTAKGGWGYTLGEAQYNWLKHQLTANHDKFKFVFCHNLLGGKGSDARGGMEYVDFFEMGGKNADSTWGFTANRPGWDKPIHQLMVENKVNVFFHGHDHCFAKQDKDGIVYQEVPQPSARNITNFLGTQYGYQNGVLMPSRGYMLVTVTDTNARLDYIRTFLPNEETGGHTNGEIAYSYSVSAPPSGIHVYNENSGSFVLSQNYPNPFRGETIIQYKVEKADRVQLKIFDICGKEINTLVSQNQAAGDYSVTLNSNTLKLNPGIFYYRITVGNISKSMKMICLE